MLISRPSFIPQKWDVHATPWHPAAGRAFVAGAMSQGVHRSGTPSDFRVCSRTFSKMPIWICLITEIREAFRSRDSRRAPSHSQV